MTEDDREGDGHTIMPVYQTVLQINGVPNHASKISTKDNNVTAIGKHANRSARQAGANKFCKLPSILNQHFIQNQSRKAEASKAKPEEDANNDKLLFLEDDEDIYLEFKQLQEMARKEKNKTKPNGFNGLLGSFHFRSSHTKEKHCPEAKPKNKLSSKTFNEKVKTSSWFKLSLGRLIHKDNCMPTSTKIIEARTKTESLSSSEPSLNHKCKQTRPQNNVESGDCKERHKSHEPSLYSGRMPLALSLGWDERAKMSYLLSSAPRAQSASFQKRAMPNTKTVQRNNSMQFVSPPPTNSFHFNLKRTDQDDRQDRSLTKSLAHISTVVSF